MAQKEKEKEAELSLEGLNEKVVNLEKTIAAFENRFLSLEKSTGVNAQPIKPKSKLEVPAIPTEAFTVEFEQKNSDGKTEKVSKTFKFNARIPYIQYEGVVYSMAELLENKKVLAAIAGTKQNVLIEQY